MKPSVPVPTDNSPETLIAWCKETCAKDHQPFIFISTKEGPVRVTASGEVQVPSRQDRRWMKRHRRPLWKRMGYSTEELVEAAGR